MFRWSFKACGVTHIATFKQSVISRAAIKCQLRIMPAIAKQPKQISTAPPNNNNNKSGWPNHREGGGHVHGEIDRDVRARYPEIDRVGRTKLPDPDLRNGVARGSVSQGFNYLLEGKIKRGHGIAPSGPLRYGAWDGAWDWWCGECGCLHSIEQLCYRRTGETYEQP